MVDWKLVGKRTALFVRTLFKSKMAIAGLVILIVYAFLAIAAPIVTPYDPQHDVVAASLSPPAWFRNFSEGTTLSQNLVLVQDPSFKTDPYLVANSGWQPLRGDSHITESFDPTVSVQKSSGSMKLSLDRSSGPLTGSFTTTFEKKFDWPYKGPPSAFIGNIAILTPTASPQEPVSVKVFIERTTTDQRIWPISDTHVSDAIANNTSWGLEYPFTNSTTWKVPTSLDSGSAVVISLFSGSNVGPAATVFSSSDTYAYGVQVTFTSSSASTSPLVVYVDEMNLKLVGTSWGLLGTDWFGYDIASELIYGARISLLVGLLAAFIGIVLGLFVGLMAGYLGKIVDEVLMRFTDMLLVIPGLPLLIVLVAVLGTQLGSSRLFVLILVIGFLGWMGFARVVRSQVLSLKERPFVEAAKAAGAGTGHITTRHIIPNIVGLIYVNLALAVPGAILSEAALSFLGLGDATVVSWGSMLNQCCAPGEGANAPQAWWWVLPPGVSIALVSLAFVMIGFSLDTLFNPRLRQRR